MKSCISLEEKVQQKEGGPIEWMKISASSKSCKTM